MSLFFSLGYAVAIILTGTGFVVWARWRQAEYGQGSPWAMILIGSVFLGTLLGLLDKFVEPRTIFAGDYVMILAIDVLCVALGALIGKTYADRFLPKSPNGGSWHGL